MRTRYRSLERAGGAVCGGGVTGSAIDKYADTAEYIIPSSTQGSTKKFKITVDDTGTLSATEITTTS